MTNSDLEFKGDDDVKRRRTTQVSVSKGTDMNSLGCRNDEPGVAPNGNVVPKQNLATFLNSTNNNNDAVSDAVLSATQIHETIVDGDIHRTGAKCVPGVGDESAPRDPHLPGAGYHVTGALRYKPGRGERTSSMSCSDKIAKW